MTTFDAITYIRRQALSPADALRFLVEHFGFTVPYARELISAVCLDRQESGTTKSARMERNR